MNNFFTMSLLKQTKCNQYLEILIINSWVFHFIFSWMIQGTMPVNILVYFMWFVLNLSSRINLRSSRICPCFLLCWGRKVGRLAYTQAWSNSIWISILNWFSISQNKQDWFCFNWFSLYTNSMTRIVSI